MPEITKLKPDHEAYAILAEVLEDWHSELIEASVTIGLEMAYPGENGDPDKSAVKLHGYECAAVVRITPYKWRVRGIADAIIEIDGKGWERMTRDERISLIDHEAAHLLVTRDKEGAVKSDAHGRPKLKMRLHDFEIGGFREIVERHGSAAIELQSLRSAVQFFRQQVFAWSDDSAPQDDDELPQMGDVA